MFKWCPNSINIGVNSDFGQYSPEEFEEISKKNLGGLNEQYLVSFPLIANFGGKGR